MFLQCILTQALLIFSGGEVCTYVSSHASELRVQVCRLCLLLQHPHAAICHSQPQQRLVGHTNCSNLQFIRSSICICISFKFFFFFFGRTQFIRSSKSVLSFMHAGCADEMHYNAHAHLERLGFSLKWHADVGLLHASLLYLSMCCATLPQTQTEIEIETKTDRQTHAGICTVA